MDLSKMDAPTLTLLGAAGCVMLTMHFTVQLVSQHLFYWKKPKEQKAILIIVLMAPLYAISSFVGLLDIQGSKTFFTFLDAVKECYEALVSLLWVNQILIGLSSPVFSREACYFTNTCIFILIMQVIAKFMALMYSYLNISISKNIVPDEIKGRELHLSFPVSLFLVPFLFLGTENFLFLNFYNWCLRVCLVHIQNLPSQGFGKP